MQGIAESLVSVIQDITTPLENPPSLLRDTATDLGRPLLILVLRNSCDVNAPAVSMKKEKDVVSHQPTPTEDLDREEIASAQYIQVCFEQVFPELIWTSHAQCFSVPLPKVFRTVDVAAPPVGPLSSKSVAIYLPRLDFPSLPTGWVKDWGS